ncbi:MAG: hypothetical protein Q8M19_14030, partial [Reyranella sp.]|nr:hypothetical protein [Reyranella sp.]
MTLDLSWPATLPLPTMEGYGIEDMPSLIRTDMEAGAPRQRLSSTQARSELVVKWEFTRFQLAIFEAWLRHRARYGATWFNMDYLAGLGLVPCEARFKNGKVPIKGRNGQRWVVTATLDVRDRPMLDEGSLDLLVNDSPE